MGGESKVALSVLVPRRSSSAAGRLQDAVQALERDRLASRPAGLVPRSPERVNDRLCQHRLVERVVELEIESIG